MDNDPSVSGALRAVLRSHGFSTEQFASAEAFLEFPNLENTWCLITDVRPAGMSGFQLKHRMMDTTPNLPIIFITATRDDTIRARALNGGAMEFFYKPVVLEDLITCLARALADRKA